MWYKHEDDERYYMKARVCVCVYVCTCHCWPLPRAKFNMLVCIVSRIWEVCTILTIFMLEQVSENEADVYFSTVVIIGVP